MIDAVSCGRVAFLAVRGRDKSAWCAVSLLRLKVVRCWKRSEHHQGNKRSLDHALMQCEALRRGWSDRRRKNQESPLAIKVVGSIKTAC